MIFYRGSSFFFCVGLRPRKAQRVCIFISWCQSQFASLQRRRKRRNTGPFGGAETEHPFKGVRPLACRCPFALFLWPPSSRLSSPSPHEAWGNLRPPHSPAQSSPAPWPTATSRAESSRCASRSGRPSPPSPQIYRIAPAALSCYTESDALFSLVVNLSRIWICAGDAAAPQRTRCLAIASRKLFFWEFWRSSEFESLFWSPYSPCMLLDPYFWCLQRQGLARRRRRRTCGTSMSWSLAPRSHPMKVSLFTDFSWLIGVPKGR
jgi:hypothetical protein